MLLPRRLGHGRSRRGYPGPGEVQADATGSYVNGTWSSLSSMAPPDCITVPRSCPTAGPVIGGEYSSDGDETNTGEIYNPVTNTWTGIAPFPDEFGDGPTAMMPDGRVLAGLPRRGRNLHLRSRDQQLDFAAEKLDGDINAEENRCSCRTTASLIQHHGESQHAQPLRSHEQHVDRFQASIPVQLADDGGMNIVPELGPGLLLAGSQGLLHQGDQSHGPTRRRQAPGGTGSWAAGPDKARTGAPSMRPRRCCPMAWSFSRPATASTAEPTFTSSIRRPTRSPRCGGCRRWISRIRRRFIRACWCCPAGRCCTPMEATSSRRFHPPDHPPVAWRPTIGSIVANGGARARSAAHSSTESPKRASYGDDAQMSTTIWFG